MEEDRKVLIEQEMQIRDEICGIKSKSNDNMELDTELLAYNMFVEAGAGAGKTYTIVQRVLNQLCIGMKPSEIVVITFTNKAAEELRGRIAKNLRERLNDSKYSGYQDKLSYALSHIDDMTISTIHSFCFKLLKERCFDAKLPMDIGLLDNEATEKQKDDIFEIWMAGLKSDDWDKLHNSDPNNKKRRQLKRDIKKVYSAICTTPAEKKVHIEKISVDLSIKDRLFKEFERIVVDLVNGFAEAPVTTFEDIIDLSKTLGDKTFLASNLQPKDGDLIRYDDKGAMDYVRFWRAFLSVESDDKSTGDYGKEKVGFKVYHEKKAFKKANIMGKNDAERKSVVEDMDTEVSGFIKEHIGIISTIMNEPVMKHRNIINEYAQNAKDYYAGICSITELTNDALLEITRDMILDNDEAQTYFAKKYSCIYVDEFQDTDSIQEAFIWRLASRPDNHDELRNGALFIVGDPKQSIYRFRGAEPQVYLDVKSRMKGIQDRGGNARVYNLQINFRSNDLVIKWVNDKFGTNDGFEPIMVSKNNTKYDYQNMLPMNLIADEYKYAIDDKGYGLKIRNTDTEHILAGVYRYNMAEIDGTSFTSSEDKIDEAYGNRIKAMAEMLIDIEKDADMQDLADLIINLHDNEKYKIVKKGKPKPIEYSDLMVLCASKSKMDMYLEYMSLRGIPVQIAGSTDPKSIMEMNAFVRIYDYLANRKSQMDRVGVIEAFRCLKLTDSEADIDRYALAIIDHMYKDCKDKTSYGIALYILKHLSVFIKKDRAFSAFEIKSIQAKIMQMIETVCRNNFGTPKDMAEKFQEYLDQEIEHELSLEEKTDAVQFMNIHKSKGLEGNIVIITDRRGMAPSVQSLWHDNEYYPKAKQFLELRDDEKQELLSERRRLEYVTATRAGQVLIFLDYQGKTNSSALFHGDEGAEYKLSELPSIAPIILSTDPHKEAGSIRGQYDPEKEDDRYQKDVIKVKQEELTPVCQRISPSNFESGKSKTKSRAIKRAIEEGRIKKQEEQYEINDDPSDEDIEEIIAEEKSAVLERPVGNVFGTTMHRALELLVDRYEFIKANTDKADMVICACVNQAISENSELLSDEDIVVYTDFLREVVRSYHKKLHEMQWLEEASEYHTELNFSYYEDAVGGEDDQLYFANKHLQEDKKLKTAPVWMNGSADLVIRFNAGSLDERILIVDYKSDNDNYLTEEEFHTSMSEKYIGQLDNYCYAMRKIYGVSPERISMSVVSFSQKDEDGNEYNDKSVRARITPIKETDDHMHEQNVSNKLESTSAKSGRGRKGSEVQYSLFGVKHTGNQAQMLVDVLKTLMEKHFDKRDKLAKLPAIELESIDNLRWNNYFSSGKCFSYQEVTYSIGTSFGVEAKKSVIRRALKICGESPDVFKILST